MGMPQKYYEDIERLDRELVHEFFESEDANIPHVFSDGFDTELMKKIALKDRAERIRRRIREKTAIALLIGIVLGGVFGFVVRSYAVSVLSIQRKC